MVRPDPSTSKGPALDEEVNPGVAPERNVAKRDVWLGAALVLLVCYLLNTETLWRPDTLRGPADNVQIAEAQAWWNGKLDLPERIWDTALKDGRVYSYFPPMFTIISAAVVPFCDGVPHWFTVAMVVAVPVCAYILFCRLTRSPVWAVVLAIGYVCGTSAWPVLGMTIRYGKPYELNHTLASIGVLLILIDYFGHKRVWLGAIGLVLTALSRQLTVVYALPLGLMALRGGPKAGRPKGVAAVGVSGLVLVCVYCGLNTLKFGHPLRTGYMLNHEGRNDTFAREAREHGLLSPHWLKRNLYYTNVGPPTMLRVKIEGQERLYAKPNTKGTGIWWTTPLLLLVFVNAPRLLRNPTTGPLLVAAAAVYAMLMFWHATGEYQRGYNRYSLDYIHVILALIAPRCIVGRWRWVTLGAVAWSVVYFRFVLPLPHLQLWSW